MASERTERIAGNESLVPRVERAARGQRPPRPPAGGLRGFVCECGDTHCDATVRPDLAAYESIRRDARLFFLVAGHETPDVERVLDGGDGCLVVREHEDATDIVEETMPRRPSD